MTSELPFLEHLARESVRFNDAIRLAPRDAEVPTCPGWQTDDLLWHLAEVQWFWGSILSEDLRTVQQIEDLADPERPEDHAGLLRFYDRWSPHLCESAAAADPSEPRWMWVSDPALHTVAYIRRRQAHEALIHRIDAELTAGTDRAPIDADLATDGVDEALRIMHGEHPDWGTFAAGEHTARFHATDTDSTWDVSIGRFTGKPPWGGEPTDDHRFGLVEDGAASPGVTVSGKAADLDLWLWGRPTSEEVDIDGNAAALAAVHAVVERGVS
ncbi:maleylpyruvate isomerase family mycothiol-dependent enzyme [Luteipulveratus mongoliensis]|uniref:Mycothiol-dependent maleylpyruvate isomerase metal-binding domain-containing protein n=1 Tax=Luteipulveratus mongoliensis TaxID=571913 RepID=A0A0K1JIM1_9MICO|nr:maleylpyruvate isomerase family mycothiol-dependent enzyme [Luteipulveratus mongoliensis]AKU16567.1 hypothetical protein VV02_13030 [Luteipulveratus mongoliensis]